MREKYPGRFRQRPGHFLDFASWILDFDAISALPGQWPANHCIAGANARAASRPRADHSVQVVLQTEVTYAAAFDGLRLWLLAI
jgi:hypothetical protein